MKNSVILEGKLIDDPQEYYAPSGDLIVFLSLRIPLPEQSPPTYWAYTYDLRDRDGFIQGSDTFLIICRDTLAKACLSKWKAGDYIYVKGRLVITQLRTPTIYSGEVIVPISEVLAEEIVDVI